MPGIELLDYTDHHEITMEVRDAIIEAVHDVLEQFNKRPSHSNFRYTLAGELDISGYAYILVVDGEKTDKTMLHKDEIRVAIKERVLSILKRYDGIAVRYRLFDSSFG